MTKTWRTLKEIPDGARFMPNFDELVHPMRRLPYRKITKNLYIDLSDGEQLSEDEMYRWWGWIGGPCGRGFGEIE